MAINQKPKIYKFCEVIDLWWIQYTESLEVY